MENQLQIRHVSKQNEGYDFYVVRMADGKSTETVTLDSPSASIVAGRPNSSLQQDIRWYLEEFLKLPLEPDIELANRIEDALTTWGIDCFNKLFQNQARDWYGDARRNGLENLRLKIASESPEILGWPWEALEDPMAGPLAHHCRIERQLDNLHDPQPLPDKLPGDCINILLVIARPYGEKDAGLHALSLPLLDTIKKWNLPVCIHTVRPPTFEQLRAMLREKPGFYHIVHFDGHADYDQSGIHADFSCTFRGGAQGTLVFETPDAEPCPVNAETLGILLAEHRIPIMVLNACQSARIDEEAEDAYASVAGSLLRGGIRSVVAMGYSLYVSGARQFVPAFYQRLLESGDASEAVRAGRQAMLLQNMRPCYFGTLPLKDWLVPVLYQQGFSPESILPILTASSDSPPGEPSETQSRLPKEVEELDPDDFIGRERAVLHLERACRQKTQGAILVNGMAGIGKTTLVKGFLRGMADTNDLENVPFWFDFGSIHSAEYVVNRLVESLFGLDHCRHDMPTKLDALAREFKNKPYILVWDNFESASGIEDTEVHGLLNEEDRLILKQLIQKLRNGKTKILITSRSPEHWLEEWHCYRLPLSGLKGEELWQYFNAVVQAIDLKLDRKNPDFRNLMERLDGHPQVLRTMLRHLRDRKTFDVNEELKELLKNSKEEEALVWAALRIFERGLPEEYAPFTHITSLHDRFIDMNLLVPMLENADNRKVGAQVRDYFHILESAGLCHRLGGTIYRIHPALRAYLGIHLPDAVKLEQGFVRIMAAIADDFGPRRLHEQSSFFSVHSANFLSAVRIAEKLDMKQDQLKLIQTLAVYAFNARNFKEAEYLYRKLSDKSKEQGNEHGTALTYLQLGKIAQERRDFNSAENWYRKARDIFEKQGDEHGAALTYLQLSMINQERRDFDSAESWCRKALTIFEKQSDEHGAALTYLQLGMIPQERRDFNSAESWYRKALNITKKRGDDHVAAIIYHNLGSVAEEKGDFDAAESWNRKALDITKNQGNEHGMAGTYYNLGNIAQKKQNFDAAESWYKEALAIFEKQGDEYGASITYHQLGNIAQGRQDFDAAESWYRRSLDITKKQDNEHSTAITYHQLGIIAQERRDFDSAESWYRKSLEITEKQGSAHGAAITYHQLGRIAQKRRDFDSAESWYRKSLEIKEEQGDEQGAAITYHQLGMIAEEGRDFDKAESWYRKSLEIKEEQGNEHGAAITYHQLGIIAQERRDFDKAESWYRKSLEIKEKQDDKHGTASTYHNLGMIAEEKRDFDAAESWYRKSLEIKEEQGDKHGAASTYHQLGIIAQEKLDFDAAVNWYRKARAIFEKQGNEHGVASTYHQLGIIAQEKRDFGAAENWYRESLEIKEKQSNERGAAITLSQLGLLNREMGKFKQSGKYLLMGVEKFSTVGDTRMAIIAMVDLLQTLGQAPEDIQAELRRLCRERGLGELMEQVEAKKS